MWFLWRANCLNSLLHLASSKIDTVMNSKGVVCQHVVSHWSDASLPHSERVSHTLSHSANSQVNIASEQTAEKSWLARHLSQLRHNWVSPDWQNVANYTTCKCKFSGDSCTPLCLEYQRPQNLRSASSFLLANKYKLSSTKVIFSNFSIQMGLFALRKFCFGDMHVHGRRRLRQLQLQRNECNTRSAQSLDLAPFNAPTLWCILRRCTFVQHLPASQKIQRSRAVRLLVRRRQAQTKRTKASSSAAHTHPAKSPQAVLFTESLSDLW